MAICTPLQRHEDSDYSRSLRATQLYLRDKGIRCIDPQIRGHANVPRARNILAATALANGATDIVFIDSDIGWEPPDLEKLLSHDVDVVAAAARRRGDHHQFAVKLLPQHIKGDEIRIEIDPERPIFEVKGVSTSFLRIRRRVFNAMALAHPEWKIAWGNVPDAINRFLYAYFFYRVIPPEAKPRLATMRGGGIEEEWWDWGDALATGSLQGEDYEFCDRWRAMGGSVWCDPTIRLRHWDEQPLTGCLADFWKE